MSSFCERYDSSSFGLQRDKEDDKYYLGAKKVANLHLASTENTSQRSNPFCALTKNKRDVYIFILRTQHSLLEHLSPQEQRPSLRTTSRRLCSYTKGQ